ncbi:uncharacterized protein LOC21400403 isoform X2 [Morus notabilis]|uniref:uncharacterized protein LOC21400403 isoform X2 n=1 Tax=Morus notabilis TaxID=981085 RepID=UPI000CED46F7|nr:uncharacterized protein LOC21400403 isoform X2 [Morus notabilis]
MAMSPKQEEEEEERELSGSEDDDVLDEDMEALRRACMITGTNPDDAAAAAAGGGSNSDEDENADEDNDGEDLVLLQNIRNRFSIPSVASEPLSMKPLCTLPLSMSDEEGDDDFETLRAVQKRFAAYDNDALKNFSEKQEQVCCMSPQKKASNDLVVDTFDVCKGLLDSQFACQTTHLLDDHLEEPPSTSIEWHQTDSSKPSTSEPSYSSFPKSAKVFMDAIKKNRSFQKSLRSKLIQIEAKIEENKKLKERVKILKDFQINCKRRTGRALSQKKDSRVQLISVKKSLPSKDSKVHEKKIPAMYYGPIENSHVANYRIASTQLPLSLERKKWSEVEKKNLEKGIRQQFQETALQIMLDQLSGTGESSGNLNDLDNILLSIKHLDITPDNMREFLPKVNWEQLASMYVAGRSGAECEARWLNFEDPLINCNPWTAQEDKNLLILVQKKGISNWFDIAVSLGTNRTPFQCLTRYQRSLNVSILKREWTKDEDAKLRSAVEAYGEGDWQFVASVLEGWTGTQCSNRWKKSLHPTRERVGRWTPDEDKRLKVAQMLFGPRNWKKIAQFVPGRTEVQCRERWVNSLDPSLNWGKWTAEEDSKLREATVKHGHCWSKVAAALPRRTDNMCRRRWKRLHPDEVHLLQAARKMQKAALICNFVDRESERPALGLNDFCPLMITSGEKVNHCKEQSGKLRGLISGKKRIKPSCKVTKNRRSKKSTENAQTGTEEGLEINNHDEVETFDEPEATIEQGSENNNSTKPGQDHPPSPQISSENGKGLTGPDGKRKKQSRKPRSTRKEHTEPDEVRECLPLQPESLNLTSNGDGIEPLAETNTTSTDTRGVSKRKYSKNVRTTNLENNNLMKPGQDRPSSPQISSENGKGLTGANGKRMKQSRKPRSTRKEHTDPVEVRELLPVQPESLNLTSNSDGIEPLARTNTILTDTRRVSKRKCSREVSENNNLMKPGQDCPLSPEISSENGKGLIGPDSKRKKQSRKLRSTRQEDSAPAVRECLPFQPESFNLTSNGDGIEPLAGTNTSLTNSRRVSKRKYSTNISTTNSEELQSTTAHSGKSLLTGTDDVKHQRNGSSCMDTTQLLMTNVEDVTLDGNTLCNGKKGTEPAGVFEDVLPVPPQDNELQKVKPRTRGTSHSDQNFGRADDEILLVRSTSKKLKRRKLLVNDCQNKTSLSPSVIQESELFPVVTLHDGNSVLSAMQDDELTCCDGGTSEKLSACNRESSLLLEQCTAVPTENEPGSENLVGGQTVACEELVKEMVSVDAQSGNNDDDTSLASLVQKKLKKERQTSKRGTRACLPSSLIRGSQLLSKRVNQLQDGDYTSSVPSGLDPLTGPEVAFDKQQREEAEDDNVVGDMTLSCFVQNKSKKRRLQSTDK